MNPWALPLMATGFMLEYGKRFAPRAEEPGAISIDDIAVGETFEKTFRMSRERIRLFAEATGDKNPVHLDDAAGKASVFKQCVAHGLLTGAFVSAVFGMDFPGPGSIYRRQTFDFLAPVFVDDEVCVKVTVTAIAKRSVSFRCIWTVKGKPVIEGEATIDAPRAA